MKKLNVNFLFFVVVLAFAAFLGSCSGDPCKDDPCGPNGDCVAVNDDYDCICDAGYEGVNCEIISRDKFVGLWDGTDVCNTGTYNYDANISISSTGTDRIIINNFGAFGTNINVPATVNGNQFTVNTTVGGAQFNGTGTISANTISVSYTVVESGGATATCNGNWTRQ